MNQRIRCPNPVCPQPDDVQKVSVVVTTNSTLRGLLAAPVRPVDNGRWGCGVVLGFVFCLSEVAFVIAAFATPTPNIFKGGTGVVGLLFFGGIATWILLYKLLARSQYKQDFPVWLRAQAKWDQLYYCNRCGSVFNPTESDKFVTPARMKELLAQVGGL